MTLKRKLWTYVVVIHIVVGGVLIWQRELLGGWLFLLEIVLVLSLLLGLRWVRIALKPSEIAQNMADAIESGEFGTRYPSVSQAEIDRVIRTYNGMLASLQHEWLRLGEQRGFLERFLAVTPIGIVIFDFDNHISLVNPRARELLELDAEFDLAGRDLSDLESTLARSLTGLDVGETRMVRAATGRHLRCQHGQFTDRGFSRSYMLIEELTAEINRSERETYEKLIRMISHEVTNTVAATNSLLESCRNYANEIANCEHRGDYENALDVLITRNSNLNEFTRGFSDLVKLPPPHREATSVGDVLRAISTMFGARMTEQDIALDVRIDEALPPVSMDRNQMDQALINIVKNSAEAIDRHGRIELVARRDGDMVAVLITDSGGGLDEASRQELFTPFFTTKPQGQGLGLTLVKEILTQHGFAFSLNCVDGGASFRIDMPIDTL